MAVICADFLFCFWKIHCVHVSPEFLCPHSQKSKVSTLFKILLLNFFLMHFWLELNFFCASCLQNHAGIHGDCKNDGALDEGKARNCALNAADTEPVHRQRSCWTLQCDCGSWRIHADVHQVIPFSSFFEKYFLLHF